MNKWFKFGLIEGMVSSIIGSILLSINTTRKLLFQGIMGINVNTVHSINILALILAIVIGSIISGVMYYVCSNIISILGIHKRGYPAVLIVTTLIVIISLISSIVTIYAIVHISSIKLPIKTLDVLKTTYSRFPIYCIFEFVLAIIYANIAYVIFSIITKTELST